MLEGGYGDEIPRERLKFAAWMVDGEVRSDEAAGDEGAIIVIFVIIISSYRSLRTMPRAGEKEYAIEPLSVTEAVVDFGQRIPTLWVYILLFVSETTSFENLMLLTVLSRVDVKRAM